MGCHERDTRVRDARLRDARGVRRAALALLTALLLAVGFLPATSSAADKAPAFRALLFTKAVGYVHDSIPAGVQMVKEQAAANNFEVVETADATVFDDAKLKDFDVIIMLQNSGMVWDTEAQRDAMKAYVKSGKGVVALHNTLD
ncbi:ThuA domain-containing protein, partial [Streptomyces sp. NPDC059900]|uniref:ThuA domain-containing protein n=1 Tax=Streptomyces sp. NPDC059900 TaxID=3155816 RepID=UPI003CFBC5E0